MLLLEPNPLHAARVFWDRTLRVAARPRVAVLALGLGAVPRAGIPDLHVVQWVLEGCSSLGAVALVLRARGAKSPLQLAALTGALLIGFELVLTHWFYLYIPWFFPFAAIAVLAPGAAAGDRRKMLSP